MTIQKRIITPELEALYHITPIETMSNEDLFQVLQFGTRSLQAKEEVISRLKSDPNFIYRLFDFGDNHIDPLASKFSDWFHCDLASVAHLDAKILNEISKNDNFKHRVMSFVPALFTDSYFTNSTKETFSAIQAYLTWLDEPQIVFNTRQGLIQPILIALKTLSNFTEKHIELAGTIRTYMSRVGSEAGGNIFLANPERAKEFQEKYLTKFFGYSGLKDLKRIGALSEAISCLDNVGYRYTIKEDASDIQKLCSSKLVPDELIIKIVGEMVNQDAFDRLSLVGEIHSHRTLDIVSNFVTRDECFKLGKRNVRGLMLEDELGL
jgi:hypothetical protein